MKRNLWNHSNHEKAPGPGSYYTEKTPSRRIFFNQDNTSWQFKSITKRTSLEKLHKFDKKADTAEN